MLNVKRSTLGVLSTVVLVLALALGLAACAPQAADSGADAEGSSAKTAQAAAGDGTGAYVSDEQCLSCHGGSYEALAETTSSYGQSNPHDSIHGGYSSCVNCHARDKEVTDNQCLHCHDWPHDPQA
ncbi:cytochrome c3 family protein [Eggerthella sp. NSJ-70]|uniref:Cytochrome c3 family protein n=1 Tax=Eggerthella hominis TaxID=2763043 RepID=A0ABR7BVV6_9ACTN|nr:cytochrome c3 family protein [Eggerthella hominis]MBC5585724.1 cytochrome c3 family protein [Eggerthella hominis]